MVASQFGVRVSLSAFWSCPTVWKPAWWRLIPGMKHHGTCNGATPVEIGCLRFSLGLLAEEIDMKNPLRLARASIGVKMLHLAAGADVATKSHSFLGRQSGAPRAPPAPAGHHIGFQNDSRYSRIRVLAPLEAKPSRSPEFNMNQSTHLSNSLPNSSPICRARLTRSGMVGFFSVSLLAVAAAGVIAGGGSGTRTKPGSALAVFYPLRP